VTARSDGSIHQVFPVAISAGESAALRRWVEHERAQRTLEATLRDSSRSPRAQVPHSMTTDPPEHRISAAIG
jgi:hypothetical protein